MRWLAMLGDMGYTFLLWLNKWYNLMRARHGKTHYLNSGDWVESMTALVEDEAYTWWDNLSMVLTNRMVRLLSHIG